jgi:hypothetical protein
MTNAERRAALNKARRMALEYAERSEKPGMHTTLEQIERQIERATMWAAVAEAMKDGDPVHDGPDGRPIGVVNVTQPHPDSLTR